VLWRDGGGDGDGFPYAEFFENSVEDRREEETEERTPIMPAKTATPIARRISEPAPVLTTREHSAMNAIDVMRIAVAAGERRRARPQ